MKRRFAEIFELTRARVLSFVREPEIMFWILVFPVVLAGVLGFAFRGGKAEDSRIVVLGEQAPAAALISKLEEVEFLRLLPLSREDAQRQLRSGAIDAIVVADTPPRLRFDPERNEGAVAKSRVLLGLCGRRGSLSVVEDRVQKTGFRYIDFLFPGLLGMNLMSTGIWGIGFALADMRQKRFLKRMLVTPMKRSSFLLSAMVYRLVFLVLEVAVLMAFGLWVLKVPMRGSLGVLALFVGVGGVSFAGLGLLLGARVRTMEGASGVINLATIPMWLCSGIFFSYERFPDAVQPLLRLLPLSALNDGLRGVMLDGLGLGDLLAPLGIISAWGVASFAVALKIFRWE